MFSPLLVPVKIVAVRIVLSSWGPNKNRFGNCVAVMPVTYLLLPFFVSRGFGKVKVVFGRPDQPGTGCAHRQPWESADRTEPGQVAQLVRGVGRGL